MKILLLGILLFLSNLFFPVFAFANNNADAEKSTISVNLSSVPADGLSTAIISVIVKDSLGNLLSGEHITLTSTTDPGLIINVGPAGVGNWTAATDSNGKAVFTVSSINPSPGTDTFTAVDVSSNPSVSLGSSTNKNVTVTFTASALAPRSSCTDTAPASAPQLTPAKTSGTNAIILTWNPASGPVTHYLVSYGSASGKYTYGNPNVGNTTSYTVGSLTKGAKYYFVVQGVNGCRSGNYSNEVSSVAGGLIPTSTLTPTTSEIASSSAKVQIEITSTKTPIPIQKIQPSPTSVPAQVLTENISIPKLAGYVFLWILIFGGIGSFVHWKRKKAIDIEENQTKEESNAR